MAREARRFAGLFNGGLRRAASPISRHHDRLSHYSCRRLCHREEHERTQPACYCIICIIALATVRQCPGSILNVAKPDPLRFGAAVSSSSVALTASMPARNAATATLLTVTRSPARCANSISVSTSPAPPPSACFGVGAAALPVPAVPPIADGPPHYGAPGRDCAGFVRSSPSAARSAPGRVVRRTGALVGALRGAGGSNRSSCTGGAVMVATSSTGGKFQPRAAVSVASVAALGRWSGGSSRTPPATPTPAARQSATSGSAPSSRPTPASASQRSG